MDYTEQNRRAWNQVQPIHLRERPNDLKAEVGAPDFNTLDAVAREAFAQIGLRDKSVAQFSCNNGRELISVLKAGAVSGVGFDIADAFIAEARELAVLGNVDANFVRANVLSLPSGYEECFDLGFATIGTVQWLENLERFFKEVAATLKPGGTFFLYEMHPILDVFGNTEADPGYDPECPEKPLFTYFETDPWMGEEGLDYYGQTNYEAETSIGFRHQMGEILTALAQAGLILEELCEYPHDISDGFASLADLGLFPASYTLRARKAG